MATTVQDIIKRVRFLIRDLNGVRWTDDEIVAWLNDGQRELVVAKPDANAVRTTITCITGPTQSLPAGGLQVLDVPCNAGGAKRAIRPLKRRVLDAELPAWRSEATSGTIKYFCYNADEPTSFEVYPPATAGTTLTVIYSDTPTPVTVEGDISIPDVYAGALTDYVVGRCYMKDADYAQSADRSRIHMERFFAIVGGRQVTEEAVVPAPGAGEPPNAV